jgi:hypothetical protein
LPYIFAEANITFQYPTVILPQSAYVSSLTCEPYGLQIGFNDTSAYQYVEQHWPSAANNSGSFMLVTNSMDCNDVNDGIHVYWLVDKLTYIDGNMTIDVTAQEIAIEDAYGEVCPLHFRLREFTLTVPGRTHLGYIRPGRLEF